eukprot:5938331-Amphidinium_carterae.4
MRRSSATGDATKGTIRPRTVSSYTSSFANKFESPCSGSFVPPAKQAKPQQRWQRSPMELH